MTSESPVVVIHFKEMEADEELRRALEERCRDLAAEFPETTRFEISLTPDGVGCVAHGHVTGRDTELATHAQEKEAGHAADRLLDKLVRQLRRVHDKRIFAHRREAQQAQLKKRG